MERSGRADLLSELNAMREKMGSTLDYWDCGRNYARDHPAEMSAVKEPTPVKGPGTKD